MRRAARKDTTHAEIAERLRNLGWSVLDLSRAGYGVPDLAVSRGRFCALLECKSPGGQLTPREEMVKANWQGPYVVAESAEEALAKLAELML